MSLGGVGDLLRDPDPRHRHAVFDEAARWRTRHREIVDSESKLGIRKLPRGGQRRTTHQPPAPWREARSLCLGSGERLLEAKLPGERGIRGQSEHGDGQNEGTHGGLPLQRFPGHE
jgi:hypothetical protein